MTQLSQKNIRNLLLVLIFSSCIYVCFSPLIAGIDSIQGFLTYQWLREGSLTFRPEVSASNLNLAHPRFTGYWSPGQWLFPAIFNYFFHLNLGVSSIIVTIISTALGMLGFYKLFRFFKFTTEVSIYSLLLIFCSYTFFYSFIVYQGGETLSFGAFPWFAYVVLSARNPSIKTLLIIAGLFFLCFLTKLTLIIYCPIVIGFKTIEPFVRNHFFQQKEYSTQRDRFLYFIPVVILFVIIWLFYLNRYPVVPGGFHPSLLDVLTPLASPLTSILSIHQVAGRLASGLPGWSMQIIYVAIVMLFLLLNYIVLRDHRIDVAYKGFFVVLYSCISLFFIVSYLFDRIDQSPRHFKFLGYLFLPGILSVAGRYLKRSWLQGLVLVVCMASTISFVYTKQGWIRGRFLSKNYFYRHYDNKDDVDRLDKESYDKLLRIAKSAPDSAIFFIQANLDVAMDIPFGCIIPWYNLDHPFLNHGPIIFACLPADTLRQYPNLLQRKFPDYKSFQLIDRSKVFVFYQCK